MGSDAAGAALPEGRRSWETVIADEQLRVDKRREWLREHLPSCPRSDGAKTGHSVGLALSGGGIRSATFSVGVLRSLSRLKLSHRIDYLSTVSGGGYAGSFFCSLFVPQILRGATPDLNGPEIEQSSTAQAKNLGNDPFESAHGRASLARLREGGHYLMPAGTTDTLYAAVIALRNWLAVATVSGFGILAFFMVVNLPRVPDSLCFLRDAREITQTLRSDQNCRQAVGSGVGSADRGKANHGFALSVPKPALPPERLSPAGEPPRPGAGPARAGGNPPLFGTSYLWLLVLALIPLWIQPSAWAYWMTRGSPFPRTIGQYLWNRTAIVALAVALAIAFLLKEDSRLWNSNIALPLGASTCAAAVFGLVYYLFARFWVWTDDGLQKEKLRSIEYRFARVRAWRDNRRQKEKMGSIEFLSARFRVWTHTRRQKKKSRSVEEVDANRVARESRIGTKLSRWLYRGVVVFCCFAILAIVDDLARAAYLWGIDQNAGRGSRGFELPASLSLLVALIVPAARWLLSQGQAAKLLSWPRLGPSLRRFGRSLALMVAIILLLALLVFWAALAYEIIWHDRMVDPWSPFTGWSEVAPQFPLAPPFLLTFFALICAFLLGHVRSFLNQSSLASFYIGRLRKAYLGATNAERTQKDEQCQIDVEHPLDDICLPAYFHPTVLAPVHLVNVTVNETTAASSRVIQRDRKGKSMTVSPAGYVTTLGKPTDDPEAFQLDQGEQLPLSSWVGISGAAFSTGVGQNTSLGQSLLAALVNMRLGYWWDSPIPPAGAQDRLFGDLVHRYLVREARAEYEGTHTNRWYLSDGGHYENTGIYELVRRRVQLIVGCDNGADPEYLFSDLVNLIRKLRIDFDAETIFLNRAELDKALGKANGLRAAFGQLEEIGGQPGDAPHQAGPYAALARIWYRAPRDAGRPPSTLILIKPRIAGGELPDLVRYKASNMAFPQQPTTDQFFDEAQWESYFRLGQLITDTIFEPRPARGPTLQPDPNDGNWWPSDLSPLP